jgi:glutaredoxin
MRAYFLLAGLVVATLGSAQAGTFRWVDKSGKVQYGDVPAEEATQLEKKKFGLAPEVEDANLPYATRHAHQNSPVTFYSAGNCTDPCKLARDFLNKRGIPFAEKSLSAKEEIDDFKQQSGTDAVPALTVGKTWLKGFEAGQWDNALDVAGYPKIAPYRPEVPPTPVKSKAEPKN